MSNALYSGNGIIISLNTTENVKGGDVVNRSVDTTFLKRAFANEDTHGFVLSHSDLMGTHRKLNLLRYI